jgi:hypothetical protein
VKELLVVGIEGSMRTHPLPKLDNFVLVPWSDQATIRSADCFIQANIKENKHKDLKDQYQYIIDSGKPYIVTESAVFRQGMNPDRLYHRWAWSHYFWDQANYGCENSPKDRWEQISQEQNLKILPWQNNKDGHILLCLQRPGDSSLHRIIKKKKSDYKIWIWNCVEEIRKYTDRTIRIRIHPLRQDVTMSYLEGIIERYNNIEISSDIQGASLENGSNGGDGFVNDLDNAYCVVGLNSNALTESVMAGIPTFSLCSGAMAYPVSNHDISKIELPIMEFDRTQWLYNLSYCQWTQDEIEQGLPWFHLQDKL